MPPLTVSALPTLALSSMSMPPLTVSAASTVRAIIDMDAAVDRAQVAIGLAGLGGDAAIDLVDVAAGAGVVMGLGGGDGEAEGEGKQGAAHGESP